jgi:hypothetical protein
MKFYYYLLAVFFVTYYYADAQQVLFEEKFAGGFAEHVWRAGFNGNVLEPFQNSSTPGGDGWVGILLNKASGGNVAQSSAENENFTDFIYEALVYIPVDEATYYGLEFRVDPNGLSSGYQFLAAFNPSGTVRMRFRARPGDSPTMPIAIMDWPASQVPGGVPKTGGWHKLAVKAVGPDFWFYFDDKAMPGCPISDVMFTSGTVGAYLWDMASPDRELLIDDIKVTSVGPAAINEPNPPASFTISPVYPNPAVSGSACNLEVTMPTGTQVQAVLYDVFGRGVRQLPLHDRNGNKLRVSIPTDGLPAGVYTVAVSAAGQLRQIQFVLVR